MMADNYNKSNNSNNVKIWSVSMTIEN